MPAVQGQVKTFGDQALAEILDGLHPAIERLGRLDIRPSGPVGIAQVTGQVIEEAGWLPLLTLAASISMSLALFNALPLPMVDGGRLFFIFLEFIRGGKRIAPEKEAMVHFAGFVALILFALVVTYFDIMRVISGDSILR